MSEYHKIEHLAMVVTSAGKHFCSDMCATHTGTHRFQVFIDVGDSRCETCARKLCLKCREAEPFEVWRDKLRELRLQRQEASGER